MHYSDLKQASVLFDLTFTALLYLSVGLEGSHTCTADAWPQEYLCFSKRDIKEMAREHQVTFLLFTITYIY